MEEQGRHALTKGVARFGPRKRPWTRTRSSRLLRPGRGAAGEEEEDRGMEEEKEEEEKEEEEEDRGTEEAPGSLPQARLRLLLCHWSNRE